MKERKQFIDAYMAQEASLSALCRQFGISRKTGYEWIGRFLGGCELADRLRTAPRDSQRQRRALRLRARTGRSLRARRVVAHAWDSSRTYRPGEAATEWSARTLSLDAQARRGARGRVAPAATARLRSLPPRLQHCAAPRSARATAPGGVFTPPRRRACPIRPGGRDIPYPAEYEVARVHRTGRLPWNTRTVFVSTVLRHQLLGLAWHASGHWQVYFGPQLIGHLVRRKTRLHFTRGEHLARKP